MKHREDELSIYSYLYLADYMYMYNCTCMWLEDVPALLCASRLGSGF